MSEQSPSPQAPVDPATQAPPPQQPAGSLLGTGKVQNQPSNEWLASLPEEIRAEGALKQFKDVGSLAKSYIHLNKKRNDSLVLPGEDAKPEEVEAFYNKLGRPESPDKYELKLPEGVQANEEMLKGFKELAHKNGILPKQAQAALDFYNDINQKAAKSYEERLDQEVERLRKKWGDDFEKNVGFANAALQEFGGNEIAEQLEKSAWGKYPPLVELLSSIGKGLTEKPLHGDGAGAMRKGADQIQARIREIESMPIILDETRKHDQNRIALIAERASLYEKLLPDTES